MLQELLSCLFQDSKQLEVILAKKDSENFPSNLPEKTANSFTHFPFFQNLSQFIVR